MYTRSEGSLRDLSESINTLDTKNQINLPFLLVVNADFYFQLLVCSYSSSQLHVVGKTLANLCILH